MIGKTLYKAKVKNGKVIIEEKTIVSTKRVFHFFDKDEKYGVPKKDVGVTCFLTKKEAVDDLVKKLKYSIDMGEKYVSREKQFLEDTKALL